MNLRDLNLRLRALFSPRKVERDLHDELSFHIEREVKKLVDDGVVPERARDIAHARFGSTTVIADECRDERGTALVDNTMSDLQYALRSLKRAPLSALTIVATVSLGLGVIAVLFSILNLFLFRYDSVPDITEMYAVVRPEVANNQSQQFTRRQFDAMRRETSVFTDMYAAVNEVDLRVEGRPWDASLVTGNFFEVVRVKAVMGRTLNQADDERGGNSVVVLSDKGWKRRFNSDPNVIGRTVMVDGAPYEVIGVMPAGFRGLEVGGPDLWAPLSRLADFVPDVRGREDGVALNIIGRLRPGLSMENARAQVAAWDSNQPTTSPEQRGLSIDLSPRRGTLPQPMEAVVVFTPLFMAFGLILLIGCANVANLLLARGVARQKEIGIRLSLGASRVRIVRQLLTESVVLALAAAIGGYLVSRIALEQTVYWIMRSMPMDIGDVNLNVPASDWRVALFLVVAAIVSTAFFGLMPALQATRIDPVRTLRGELVKDARPGRARNVLIGVQVFASALLLICASIFLRSSIASSQFDPGLRTADNVLIEINEPKRTQMLHALATEPTIIEYAAVKPALLAMPESGFADTGAGKKSVSYKFVSAPYFDVIGVPILRGRAFSPAERDDAPVAIVSEYVAKELWPNGNAVGQTFRLEAAPPRTDANALLTVNPQPPSDEPAMAPRTVTVIGVSRDVPGFRLTDVREAGVFLPTTLEMPKTTVVARIQGEPDMARQRLLENLSKVDPNLGMIITLRTVARLELFLLQVAFWISVVLGGLALLLTVSGLFSVLSYLVEQRTREIGVRMALGASSQKVASLMLMQTARPVMFGLVGGAALAASLATLLLGTEFGGVLGQIVHVTDPVAYLGSLIVIIGACLVAAWIPASRASRVDPMKTLRQE